MVGVGDNCRGSVLITGVTGLESTSSRGVWPVPTLKYVSVARVEFNFVFFSEDVYVLEVS